MALKRCVLLVALLVMVPLSAQSWEVGLFSVQQSYNSISYTPVGHSVHGSASRKSAEGGRLGCSVLDLGPALLQVTAAVQPSITTPARLTSTGSTTPGPGNSTDSGPLDYRTSFTSAGVMLQFKAPVIVGAGLEMRFEKLGLPATESSLARPWLRANLGMASSTPRLKLFIALEVAAAITSKDDFSEPAKSLAPKTQVGVYAGIRF